MAVEFEENNIRRRDFVSSEPKGMTGWLISHGIAKNPAAANAVQVIVSIIFFSLAIYFAVR